MLPQPESACLVIADIAGYTGLLAGVELEHAQDIIADVMDTMVRRLRPPFRLAKFEGDAAFFYAVADKVDGSVLQDAVEAAYFAFRKRLPQRQPSNLLRVQRLQPDAGSRPQIRLPPRRVHQAEDVG
jgi:hypothetical protein